MKEYFSLFDDDNRLRYRIRVEKGQVVDFVVQYETYVGDDFRPVVRYDASHGRPHRDVLDLDGSTMTKEWLPEFLDNRTALNFGAAELRENWRQYRERFLERIR